MGNSARIAAALLALAFAGHAGAMITAGSIEQPPESRSRTTTIVENDGTRTVSLSIRDGNVSAQINGADVPQDRISRENGAIVIKDEAGAEIYRFAEDAGGRAAAWTDQPPFPGRLRPGMPLDPGAWRARAAEPESAPKSMIGVQLVEPDASLRGHFGLKRGEAVLVAAVYDTLPAAQAGLQPYDLIIGVEGAATASLDELRAMLRQKDPGAPVTLSVIQKGERKTIVVTPEKFDREKLNRAKVERMAAGDFSSPFAAAFSGDFARLERLDALNEQMNGAFADGFKNFGKQFAHAWNTPEAREKFLQEFRQSWKNIAPGTWNANPEIDPLIAVMPGPQGDARAQVFMRFRADQDRLERLNALADELKALADLERETVRATPGEPDLRLQIERLQAEVNELKNRERRRHQRNDAPPTPPTSPAPPTPAAQPQQPAPAQQPAAPGTSLRSVAPDIS